MAPSLSWTHQRAAPPASVQRLPPVGFTHVLLPSSPSWSAPNPGLSTKSIKDFDTEKEWPLCLSGEEVVGSPQQLISSQLLRLSRKQGNSLPGKTSSNSNSEFVFHSKVIAKETVKQSGRQQLVSQVWGGLSGDVTKSPEPLLCPWWLNCLHGLMSWFFAAPEHVWTCSPWINNCWAKGPDAVPCCIPHVLCDL